MQVLEKLVRVSDGSVIVQVVLIICEICCICYCQFC